MSSTTTNATTITLPFVLSNEQKWQRIEQAGITLLGTFDGSVTDWSQYTKLLMDVEDPAILNYLLNEATAYTNYLKTGEWRYIGTTATFSFSTFWARFKCMLEQDHYTNSKDPQSGIISHLWIYFSIPTPIDKETVAILEREEKKEIDQKK
jgi:hypothetical protein